MQSGAYMDHFMSVFGVCLLAALGNLRRLGTQIDNP